MKKTFLEWLISMTEERIKSFGIENAYQFGLETEKYGLAAFQSLPQSIQQELMAAYCYIYSPIQVGDKMQFNEGSDIVTCEDCTKTSVKSANGHWYDRDGTIKVHPYTIKSEVFNILEECRIDYNTNWDAENTNSPSAKMVAKIDKILRTIKHSYAQ